MDRYYFFRAKNVWVTITAACLLSACGSELTPPTNHSNSSQSSAIDLVQPRDGYVELADGRGDVTYESVHYSADLGFNKESSLIAFKETLYPLLRTHCAECHDAKNTSGSGAQAPLLADANPALAHEHALTKVHFRDVHDSKLSTRLWIDRHNCFTTNCATAAETMDAAITAWRSHIQDMLAETPRTVPADVKISNREVENWIAADKAQTPQADHEFIQYASFHTLHNEGVSAEDLNLARVGLSKALNSLARWAPEIVNPTDINGKGMVYRFDIRDYWGYTLIDTTGNYELFWGGSDDDLYFANKVTISSYPLSPNSLAQMKNRLKDSVTLDDKFARLVWQRILRGNLEGATDILTHPPYIDGFIGERSMSKTNSPYIKAEDFHYAEASQLIFTLTRPDVYNAIMAIPGYAHWLEEEVGVNKSEGVDSFNYMIQYEAISIDSRLYYRAEQNTGRGQYFWKTFDTYATGQKHIDEIYAAQEQNSPFWEAPIPVFISAGGQGGTRPGTFSMIATRNLGPGGMNGGGFYTGTEAGSPFGGQQSFESIIYSLANGLQGYAIYGGYNQRRTDIFTNAIRDPRLMRETLDDELDNYAGYGFSRGSESAQLTGMDDTRLNLGSSCMGCHADGINRGNNNLRDWLDENPSYLPSGDHGVDPWINDPDYVARVKALYKPTQAMRKVMEYDRRVFLEAMGKIKQGMIIGPNKNIYQEPTIWSIEWARKYYQYPSTRST